MSKIGSGGTIWKGNGSSHGIVMDMLKNPVMVNVQWLIVVVAVSHTDIKIHAKFSTATL